MKNFIAKLGDCVMGVLSGFDRLLFRGILRCVIDSRGMSGHLWAARVKMADFKEYAQDCSRRVKEASLQHAQQTGREVRYLPGNNDAKKQVALQIAARDQIREGLICVLTAVEPCISFHVRRHRETKTIELERAPRKCLHLYHYFNHARFGLMHVRLQTWFPFTVQVCLNGHEWLSRQLTQAGIPFVRRDNCITEVTHIAKAQELYDEQLTVAWADLLRELTSVVHPAHEQIFAQASPQLRQYYWSVAESEWSSDILFRDPAAVLPLTERLVRHSLLMHGPGDVLRFMGRSVCADGLPRSHFGGTIKSNVKRFETGLRIKHWLNSNSLKLYNRPGDLRIESTINDPGEFKVWRTPEGEPDVGAAPQWLRLRKGIADLHRRAEVSQAANERFATALAAALNDDQTVRELAAKLCQPVLRAGREKPDGTRAVRRRFRALNPLSSDDLNLLTAVSRPEFTISGLRNHHLRVLLFGADPADAKEKRRRSSAISRKLSLLRAHGLVEKVSKCHQYRVTEKGRAALTALLTAANTTTNTLSKIAA